MLIGPVADGGAGTTALLGEEHCKFHMHQSRLCHGRVVEASLSSRCAGGASADQGTPSTLVETRPWKNSPHRCLRPIQGCEGADEAAQFLKKGATEEQPLCLLGWFSER